MPCGYALSRAVSTNRMDAQNCGDSQLLCIYKIYLKLFNLLNIVVLYLEIFLSDLSIWQNNIK
jgi:hypothetical protein